MAAVETLAVEVQAVTGNPNHFGSVIVNYRTQLNLTQRKIAEKLAMSCQAVSNIENGKVQVSLKSAIRYTKMLGLPEALAIVMCLQDKLDRENLKYRVNIFPQ